MKKTVLAVILCTALLAAGCTAPGAGSSGAQKEADAKQESAVEDAGKEEKTDAAQTGLSGDLEGSADTASAAAAETSEETSEETSDAAAVTSQKAAAEPAAGTGEAAVPEEAAGQEQAASEGAVKTEETVAAGGTGASAQGQDQGAEESGEEEKSAGLPDRVVPGGAASAYVFPEYPEEPIPDYYTPYGVWTLVYDSGFEVKTRYSEAGLTYYKESEEFFFRLNKDLPDFRAETAHMLFNTAGPMDPAEAGDEVFPYEEGYVIYVQLDDGSAYQISKWDLDLRGRIFVRELYESFRQKWEGAF